MIEVCCKLATVGNTPDFSFVLTNLAAGFILLVGILIASAMVERFFCRYLCPMGAIFTILSKLRIAKIRKPSAQCGNCRICTSNCAMGIPLYKMESVNSGECINCMKCVTSCPRNNADFSIIKTDVRPLLAGAATVAIITGMYYSTDLAVNAQETSASTSASEIVSSSPSSQGASVSAGASSASSSNPASSSSVSSSQAGSSSQSVSVAAGIYIDGTYTGSGRGFRGTTTVSVIVAGGKITSITVVSTRDDQKYFKRAYSSVSSAIISSQSTDVDAVSGATYSCKGIMSAVTDALSGAIA